MNPSLLEDGSSGRVNSTQDQNDILVEENGENQAQSVAVLSQFQQDDSLKMKQRGFRLQLKKMLYRKS